MGTALSLEWQPGELREGTDALMWSGEPASRETHRQEEVRQMGSWQRRVPAHLCQKNHGAALTQADGLQKLVLMLEGLLDLKIKM